MRADNKALQPTLFDHRPPRPPCSYCAGHGVLEATDMFCGAGGSSLGLEFVGCPMCGRQLIHVTQAINHWDLAVQAHNVNFPNADHDVHDVDEVPASRFRRTPLFWASPECVNHTSCKGQRDEGPEAQRSRATFKDIVRFTAHHRYDAVIVENVVEARLWCEHANCACGAEFDAWFKAIIDLGYQGQIVYFNSQFALPTPQSRDRMYIVFWRDGVPAPNLNFRPASWCTSCAEVVHGIQTWKPASKGSARERIHEWGRYGAQYTYVCPNEGCGQPVAPAVVGAKTIIDWTLPIERIGDRQFKNGKPRPLAPNTRKRIKVGWENIGRRRPITVQVGGNLFERDGKARVWSIDDRLRTVTGTPCMALATPEKPDAMICRLGGQSPVGRDVDEPMNTITAHDRQMGLILANMNNATGGSLDEPTRTLTTGSGGNQMLVQPPEAGLVEFRGQYGTMRDVEEPAHTLTAGGTHHGMLVYNGMPGHVRALGEPAGVVTARDHHSLLVPYSRDGVARSTAEPAHTITTHDKEALVITEAEIDDCYFRMLQWPELLRAQKMEARPDGSPYELTARRRNHRGQYVGLSNELRTKMIGNAVSSPVATMLGHAIAEVLR